MNKPIAGLVSGGQALKSKAVFGRLAWPTITMLCVICTTGRARAEDCTTNTIVGIVTNVAGEVIVGDTGRSNALIVAAGGVLCSGSGTIGRSNSACWNLAAVTGAGSAWFNTNTLTVGFCGSNNRLEITEGGWVTSASGNVGGETNTVLVRGPGSRWCSTGMVVSGVGSHVFVDAGGALYTTRATVGSFGYNNGVILTGQGSVWLNADAITLGADGCSNPICVLDAAVITNGYTLVGGVFPGMGWSNTIVVAGPGTRWVNSGYFVIGQEGCLNALIITNGGQVVNTDGQIGLDPWAQSNAVVVSGSGASWVCRSNLCVGTEAPWCSLIISDAGAVSNVLGFVGRGTGAHSNAVVVTGPGSTWHISSNLYVGYQGWQNTLGIHTGAEVRCANCFLGYLNNSSDNRLVIDGTGSLLRVENMLEVGACQARNRIIVTNGGMLASQVAYIGSGGTPMLDMDNSVEVSGPGSKWENALAIYLGNGHSRNNKLYIRDGGRVTAPWLIAGKDLLGAPNTVIIEGGELILTNGTGTGFFDARYGTLYLRGGMLLTDFLICTNSGVNFVSGTIAATRTIATKTTFFVGSGTDAARFQLQDGVHTFAKGLVIAERAQLTGAGTISGNITNAGTIRPGTGTISVTGNVVLSEGSTLEFELGGAETNQSGRLLITGNLVAGGVVVVTLRNGFAPRPGDTFNLLGFAGASGVFGAVILPEDYAWTNRLLIDGTVAVVGLNRVKFDPPVLAGTNLILAGQGGVPARTFHLLSTTNILLPLSNWQVLMTNTFGPDGGFSVTTRIDPQTPHRFFKLAY